MERTEHGYQAKHRALREWGWGGPFFQTLTRVMFLIAVDVAAVCVALAVALVVAPVWANAFSVEVISFERPVGMLIAFGLLTIAALAFTGAYESSRSGSMVREFARVVGVVSFIAMVLGMIVLPFSSSQYGIGFGAALWVNGAFFLLIGRTVGRQGVQFFQRHGVWRRSLVIVGNEQSALRAARELQEGASHYELVGMVTLTNGTDGAVAGPTTIPRLGKAQSLSEILAAQGPCDVLVAAEPHEYSRLAWLIQTQIPPKATVHLALTPLIGNVRVHHAASPEGMVSAVRIQTSPFPWQYDVLKRALDVVLATTALIALAPIMLMVAMAVKFDSSGPIFYKQTRVGKWGRPFAMYKFRSMRPDAESLLDAIRSQNEATGPMFKIRQDPRVTRVGRFIRRASVDELPQLFNVLEGSMSLVGPRPPLPTEAESYQPAHLRRLDATPGITGLWQVSRGDMPDFDFMIQRDFDYIERWSLGMDLMIMARTIPTVITARGAC